MRSIDEIRVLLCSTHERTRALAVRSICPCVGSFEALRELNAEIRHLAFGDPSARVRGEAKHVLGDALVVNLHDEEKLMRDECSTAINEREQEGVRPRTADSSVVDAVVAPCSLRASRRRSGMQRRRR